MYVFVTGATGYLGRPLTASLLANGHRVTALARTTSRERVTPGCTIAIGDALDAGSYRDAVPPADTFVHLVGTPHPSPRKTAEFEAIDLVSIQAAVAAAQFAGVRHFVYVSVAQPAPMMHSYIVLVVGSCGRGGSHAPGPCHPSPDDRHPDPRRRTAGSRNPNLGR